MLLRVLRDGRVGYVGRLLVRSTIVLNVVVLIIVSDLRVHHIRTATLPVTLADIGAVIAIHESLVG